jgi:hypothetical protein
VRVEGPGTALEFNPGKEPVNREAAVRPPVGERPREEKPTGNKTNLINGNSFFMCHIIRLTPPEGHALSAEDPIYIKT